MGNKQEQIEAKRKKPIEVGDYVRIKVSYTISKTIVEGRGKNKTYTEIKEPKVFDTCGTVKSLGNKIKIQLGSISIPHELNEELPTTYDQTVKSAHVEPKYVQPTFDECGANPFGKEKRRINFYNKDIVGLLMLAAYYGRDDSSEAPNYSDKKHEDGTTHGGVNFNPYIIDTNGERKYYQRDFVWSLEQKQLLIDSIYNGIEIGKFLFRYNSWKRLDTERTETGHGHSWDCVDGKQRFYAILHFVQNKFADSHGNYWNDLSPNAQSRFLNYGNLSYGEMPEDATDAEVVDNFLTLNFTGIPMSKEHIEYVQSFKI